jgi:hypothetical protein
MMELQRLEAHLDEMTPEETRRELPSVVAALSHPETFIRSAAIAAWARAGEAAQVRDRLRVETDDLVMSDACDALATARDVESVPLLHSVARNSASRLARSSAIAAIVSILQLDAADFLAERAVDENDERVQLEIYRGLLIAEHRSALEKIAGALHSSDYQVRCAAAELLSEYTPRLDRDRVVSQLNQAVKRETTEAARSSMREAIARLTSS